MTAIYTGEKHCELVHEPSGSKLQTDAPKDNAGKGEAFSPTDLMGAALVSCILTTMAIFAERDGISIKGAKGEATKEMISDPRRIGALRVKIQLPARLEPTYRKKMETIANTCPVYRSLHADVLKEIIFEYI